MICTCSIRVGDTARLSLTRLLLYMLCASILFDGQAFGVKTLEKTVVAKKTKSKQEEEKEEKKQKQERYGDRSEVCSSH